MPSQRQQLIVLFFLWWLGIILNIVRALATLSPANLSRVKHVAAARLVEAYDRHRGKPRPKQGGERITPEWLESLTWEQATYYFRCVPRACLYYTCCLTYTVRSFDVD
jgi:hypothetical protein